MTREPNNNGIRDENNEEERGLMGAFIMDEGTRAETNYIQNSAYLYILNY